MAVINTLLIEDDPLIAEVIQDLLAYAHGGEFRVSHASTLAEGRQLLADKGTDVILLDLGLPDSHGLDTLARVSATAPQVPVVIMTGTDDEALAIGAMGQGAEDYLVKTQAMNSPSLTRSLLYAMARKRGAEAMRRREGILQAVHYATEEFLKSPSWEVRIHILLERLGTLTDASRIYVLQNQEKPGKPLQADVIHEWLAPDCPLPLKESKHRVFSFHACGLDRWQNLLGQGKAIYGQTDTFPETEQAVLNALGTKSILLQPVFVDDQWWGCIGFDRCGRQSEWTRAEIEMLQTAANALSLGIQRRPIEAALQAAHAKLVTAREEERRHLARELHDSVAQKMLIMQFRLQQARGLVLPAESSPLGEALDELSAQAKDIIAEIRQISHGLYPTVLEHFGLCAALNQLAELFRAGGTAISADWQPPAETLRFNRDVEIGLFRIAQEAVHNAVRHGHPNSVTLTLKYEDQHCVLTVVDDGKGFEPELVPGSGLGLTSMQEHAEALGGDLTFSVQPGRTCVTTRVPAQAHRATSQG